MPLYRKKPVIITAAQWDGTEESKAYLHSLFPNMRTTQVSTYKGEITHWQIGTLEGSHKVSPGDYVIQGVAGEYYPCKPEIFAQTYEPAI